VQQVSSLLIPTAAAPLQTDAKETLKQDAASTAQMSAAALKSKAAVEALKAKRGNRKRGGAKQSDPAAAPAQEVLFQSRRERCADCRVHHFVRLCAGLPGKQAQRGRSGKAS
jgi:hypothetical protein